MERPSRRGRLSSRRAARAAADKKKSGAREEAKTLKISKSDTSDASSSSESSAPPRDRKRPAPSSRPRAKEASPYDPQVPGTADLPRPAGDAPNFDVELGAHSGSNFYKGLSGNDVIDHGGLFVATYQFPSRGTAITVKVHLPGDLAFTAEAIVQWTRDTRSGESEPGFGARITRISAEGRQLVYRYVRNREPIFYDDF